MPAEPSAEIKKAGEWVWVAGKGLKKPTTITVLVYESVVSLQCAVLVTLLGTGAQPGQALGPVSLPTGFLLSEHLQDPVGSSLCQVAPTNCRCQWQADPRWDFFETM